MAEEGRRAVKTGDVIAEIETDKATMEYEAVDDGMMAKIVVPEGTQDVPVNQLIAVMAGRARTRRPRRRQRREQQQTQAPPRPKRRRLAESRALGIPSRRSGMHRKRRPHAPADAHEAAGRPRGLSPASVPASTAQPHLLLAASAPARQGGRHRHRSRRRLAARMAA